MRVRLELPTLCGTGTTRAHAWCAALGFSTAMLRAMIDACDSCEWSGMVQKSKVWKNTIHWLHLVPTLFKGFDSAWFSDPLQTTLARLKFPGKAFLCHRWLEHNSLDSLKRNRYQLECWRFHIVKYVNYFGQRVNNL